jgi:hypothetical protein
VSPVRHELGFCIPEDDILHSCCLRTSNLTSTQFHGREMVRFDGLVPVSCTLLRPPTCLSRSAGYEVLIGVSGSSTIVIPYIFARFVVLDLFFDYEDRSNALLLKVCECPLDKTALHIRI